MKIYQVDQVTVTTSSGPPAKLTIHAWGLAATSGWTNPRLDPVTTDSEDQILEFDFDADPPSELALQVLTPIQAETEVEPSKPVSAVTVIARTNRITVHASQFTAAATAGPACGPFTTHIAGEEQMITTMMVGEEHHLTTLAIGEEHVTTLVAGEEHPTTTVKGEESVTNPQLDDPPGPITTMMVGEEHHGGGPFGGF